MARSLVSSPFSAARMQPLVFSIVTLLGLSAPAAMASTIWTVNSCNDSGAGSLRAVIGAATTMSGDTLDLSFLACSSISLHTGAITIPQADLTIIGPTTSKLAVTGMYNGVIGTDRLFKHMGSGTLSVQNLDMKYGNLQTSTTTAAGGCIYSKGTVQLQNVFMTSCEAHSVSGAALGGGIYATAHIGMIDSHVATSGATSDSGVAHGGGVYSRSVSAQYSTIDFNATNAQIESRGGGIFSTYEASLVHSTISNNSASATTFKNLSAGGGIYLVDTAALSFDSNSTFSLVSSTVSNNYAGFAAGILTQARHDGVFNSTIVDNASVTSLMGMVKAAAGLAVVNGRSNLYSVDVTLQSSLMANNTYISVGPGAYQAPHSFDLTTAYEGGTTYGLILISGANNLVRSSYTETARPPPADTLTVCPSLGQLRFNGGPTKTVALLSRSPGIDSGNNSGNETQDQRGSAFDVPPYQYPRQSNGIADIGAYEVNQDDIVFNTNFEDCVPIGNGGGHP